VKLLFKLPTAWTDAIPALISADNPRTAPVSMITRATGLSYALTNTSMGTASAHPALTLLLLRSFHFIQKDKRFLLMNERSKAL